MISISGREDERLGKQKKKATKNLAEDPPRVMTEHARRGVACRASFKREYQWLPRLAVYAYV